MPTPASRSGAVVIRGLLVAVVVQVLVVGFTGGTDEVPQFGDGLGADTDGAAAWPGEFGLEGFFPAIDLGLAFKGLEDDVSGFVIGAVLVVTEGEGDEAVEDGLEDRVLFFAVVGDLGFGGFPACGDGR
ncbi:hypothetical protein D3C59_36575 [Streptomyces sp. SHP22-7]|nr:hypothetical protein D3C59_36575 [Streptomyces sp. SHP22-7]